MAKGKAEPPRPTLAEEERALWAHITRDARPLKPKKRMIRATPAGAEATGGEREAARAPTAPPRPPSPPLPKPVPLPELSLTAAPGLDARTAERLRRGELGLDARLDLHFHTQEEAHSALDAFVERAWRARARTLLIVTGKGRERAGEGILQAAVPRWLNEAPLRARVLAFARARPKDGGAGALYVLLRRQR